MAIHYTCRHCQATVGVIKQQVSADKLGFTQLSGSERTEMLSYDASGDIHVHIICEDCHETLLRNPDLHGIDQIIQ